LHKVIDLETAYCIIRGYAGIAQLVEHNLAKVGVGSSSLLSRSKFFHSVFLFKKMDNPAEIAQLVEHNLAKVGVESSSLFFRSKFKKP
jgi:hydroxyethylthiazole kinase-like sugar kinase family protein